MEISRDARGNHISLDAYIYIFKVTTWKENYAPAVTTALVGQVFVNKDEGKNYSLKPIAAIKKKEKS